MMVCIQSSNLNVLTRHIDQAFQSLQILKKRILDEFFKSSDENKRYEYFYLLKRVEMLKPMTGDGYFEITKTTITSMISVRLCILNSWPYISWINKTKYFRLRLTDEVGTERSETDLRLIKDWPETNLKMTWDWPETDLRLTWDWPVEEKNGKIMVTAGRQSLDRWFVGEIKIENSIYSNQITIKSISIAVAKEPEMFECMRLGFRF